MLNDIILWAVRVASHLAFDAGFPLECNDLIALAGGVCFA